MPTHTHAHTYTFFFPHVYTSTHLYPNIILFSHLHTHFICHCLQEGLTGRFSDLTRQVNSQEGEWEKYHDETQPQWQLGLSLAKLHKITVWRNGRNGRNGRKGRNLRNGREINGSTVHREERGACCLKKGSVI